MWAVTLIGAPQEGGGDGDREPGEECARLVWRGGGHVKTLNGDINTGILIRTTYLRDGYATYPAGATLLYDSDPASE